MRILNLTQHNATIDQINAGVVDVDDPIKPLLNDLLTFNAIPDNWTLNYHAQDIVDLIRVRYPDFKIVMIGGAPFFMPVLTKVLKDAGYKVVFAFSRRESSEVTTDEGKVVKTQVFKHIGFVEV